jgi:topoisomerase IV subunit B
MASEVNGNLNGNGNYSESSIQTLEWNEHIRMRPGMYIGKLGDGSSRDDGIYVLLKEVIDNSIDEYIMGYGRKIEIEITDNKSVVVRDYGRGIPLGSVVDVVSKMNTGAKYDSEAFKRTVGLNGVGVKAVNALADFFRVQSFRDNESVFAEFGKGGKLIISGNEPINKPNGTEVRFIPDPVIFGDYEYLDEHVEKLLWNYAFLNRNLKMVFNKQVFQSQRGLYDLLEHNISGEPMYPIVHIEDKDFEFAFTHINNQYGEDYYAFVNGQYTSQGGTHVAAFKETLVKTIREFFKKEYEASDIRSSISAALSIKIHEPVFESQTKTKLGSQHMEPNGRTIRYYINEVVKKHLDNYLHMNPDVSEAIQMKILQNEKERKEMANIKKLSRDSIKKVNLHNKKLRDCRIHLTDHNNDRKLETTLFITEGDSASGSITKSRDVNTQAVFSLKGKPLNSYGQSKKIVYENDEFNLLQAALNIEDGLENLRYNNIVVATDADVDGMHIRLLLLTFFLQFFPDLVRAGHLYILQTPLFRVRNRQKTIYCYNSEEKLKAMDALGKNPEITRFKGLGEISPDEFKHFIGSTMRLDPVILKKEYSIKDILSFYMGKNTPERQEFIIENLRYELDELDEKSEQKVAEPLVGTADVL